ncbi:Pentatricopeptide repeat-containing protein [Platanthera zijinensis]|uniref:Pentatricopeptide repeat-containing protein n=1 Tax=Platanthera zijinensis TaxID=2320716 RepID=A0AAP0BK08_9ASPA
MNHDAANPNSCPPRRRGPYWLPPPPDLSHAGRLPDLFPHSTFECNKLLRAYSASPVNFHLCLTLFSSMRRSGRRSSPNLHSFTFAISACAASSRPYNGRALHALLSKLGFELDAFVSTSLLQMYAKTNQLPSARKLFDEIPHRDVAVWNSMITGHARSGDLASARELFDDMPVRNVISWTSMISGYSQSERYEEAIKMFSRMSEASGVTPNEVTLTSILPACANLGNMELGEKLEAFARKNGLFGNVFVGSSLVEMYAKCGDVGRAAAVFREIAAHRNVCSWNSMIMGFAVHGRWKESLLLFQEMKWGRVASVRRLMKGRRAKKSAGYSLIESAGSMHRFLVEDKSHPRTEEIYELLDWIYITMGLIFSDSDAGLQGELPCLCR